MDLTKFLHKQYMPLSTVTSASGVCHYSTVAESDGNHYYLLTVTTQGLHRQNTKNETSSILLSHPSLSGQIKPLLSCVRLDEDLTKVSAYCVSGPWGVVCCIMTGCHSKFSFLIRPKTGNYTQFNISHFKYGINREYIGRSQNAIFL